MLRVKALTACAVLFSAASGAGAAAAPDETTLAPRTAQSGAPLDGVQLSMELPHLALAIAVDPALKTIRGKADYTVRAAAPLDRIEFDLDPRFAVTGVTLRGTPLRHTAWSSRAGLLSIRLPRPLPAGGEVALSIAYNGSPREAPRPPWDGGFVWSKTEGGQPWIATAIQGEGCDLMWPCLDHPSKRVELLDLAISVPEGLVAASNGRLVGQETSGGRTTWTWHARQPNSYGVSLQIGPYELAQAEYRSRFGTTIPIRFWHLPGHAAGAQRLVGELGDFLDFFESWIGPYPFADEKVGVAETPHLGMEHQTINAYGADFKPAAEGYDWLLHHEFSHEWFANQLSNAETADMWLQEGLGTYMQALYLQWRGGEMPYAAKMWDLRKQVLSRVPLAPRSFIGAGYYLDRKAGWGDDIYYKGAWVAHSLRYLIGDEAFFAALTRLVYGRGDPAPGNFDLQIASTDDFMRIAEQASGRDLGWFFEAYARTAALPELEQVRAGNVLELRWQTPSPQPFPMPIDVEVDGRVVSVPMPGGRGEVALQRPDAHVVIDPAAKVLRYDPAIADWRRSITAADN